MEPLAGFILFSLATAFAVSRWRGPRRLTLQGPRCPLCLRTHPVGHPFTQCQYEDCRDPAERGACVCNACYVKELTNSPRTELLRTAQTLGGMNAGPIDVEPPAPIQRERPARAGSGDARERALLEAVSALPDEDSPRLVLADLWAERGDPQCEYLALTLRSALATRSPEWLRAKRLHDKWRPSWLPGGVEVRSAVFHRGLLARCRLEGPVQPEHRAWATVEAIDCAGVALPAELLRSGLPLLRELDALELSGLSALCEGPARARMKAVGLSSSARELNEALALVDTLPALETLGLCEVELSPERLRELIVTLGPRLAVLRCALRWVDLEAAQQALARHAPSLKLALRVARNPQPSWVDLHRGVISARKSARWLNDVPYVIEKLGADAFRAMPTTSIDR